MVDALEGMQVPPSVLVALLADAESKAEAAAVSPGARGLMGHPAALVVGGGIAIVDTIAIAAGVTIVVAISISLVQEAADSYAKKRRRRQCFKRCDDEAEVCEENCRNSTKEGTGERRLCWAACNEGNAQCKR